MLTSRRVPADEGPHAIPSQSKWKEALQRRPEIHAQRSAEEDSAEHVRGHRVLRQRGAEVPDLARALAAFAGDESPALAMAPYAPLALASRALRSAAARPRALCAPGGTQCSRVRRPKAFRNSAPEIQFEIHTHR